MSSGVLAAKVGVYQPEEWTLSDNIPSNTAHLGEARSTRNEHLSYRDQTTWHDRGLLAASMIDCESPMVVKGCFGDAVFIGNKIMAVRTWG